MGPSVAEMITAAAGAAARGGRGSTGEVTSLSLCSSDSQQQQPQRHRRRPRFLSASISLAPCFLLLLLLLLLRPEAAPAFTLPPSWLAAPAQSLGRCRSTRCLAMRAKGTGSGGDSGGGGGGGWMAPFAQALQGLRSPAPAPGSDNEAPATSPLAARRGPRSRSGSGSGSGGSGSSRKVVGKKGAATLQKEKKERRLGRDLQLTAAHDEEREAASAAAPWGMSRGLLAAGVLLPTLLAVGVALYQSGLYESVQGVNIAEVFREVEAKVTELGPWGYVLFAAIYILAEVLAVPAVPLTASSGYLFGLVNGTAIVVVSATIAAALSFIIGRTLLRSVVERWMDKYPKFQALDKAIKDEGFKIILLLRLSPIFPFALSNYMYGLTAVDFWPYFWATLLGFLPGTIAYVYSGYVGRNLTEGGGLGGLPWYGYVAAAVGLGLLGKVVSDAANRAIGEYEPDEMDGSGI